MSIRKNDEVEVIAGDDRGVRSRVLRVIKGEDGREEKVVVENVNKVYRHMKPSQRNRQGGRLSKEMPISASNVKLVCRSCNSAVRMGVRYTAEGRKERFCKKCQGGLGFIGQARAAYANK